MSQVSTDWTCPFAARCERRQAGAQPSEGVQPPELIMDSYQTVLPLGIFRNTWGHQNDSWGLCWIPAVCGKFYQRGRRVPKLGSRMSAEVEGSRKCVSVRWMALVMSRISANQNYLLSAPVSPPSAGSWREVPCLSAIGHRQMPCLPFQRPDFIDWQLRAHNLEVLGERQIPTGSYQYPVKRSFRQLQSGNLD